MKHKKFDNLMRQAFAWMEKQKETKVQKQGSQRECLSEETVCDYLGSKLSNTELETVEKHLSLCPKCRWLVTTVVELEKREKEEGVSAIKAKIGAVAETLKISLAWIQGHLSIKETNAESFPFWNVLQPVLARGDTQHKGDLQQTSPTLPSFSKTFQGHKVVVQITEEEEGKCEIRCQIFPLGDQSLGSRIRVDLLQAERTLSSYPLENDTVVLSGIEPGEYEIKIREGDSLLALLSVNVVNRERG